MGLVVTGISPNGDLSAVQKTLREAGVSPDNLQVVGPGDAAHPHPQRPTIISDIGSSDYGTGTGVPGISDVHRMPGYFRSEGLDDRLGDFEIPESQLDNYVEAIQRGRSVIAYFASEDSVARVEEAFRAANLLNVRRF